MLRGWRAEFTGGEGRAAGFCLGLLPMPSRHDITLKQFKWRKSNQS